MAKKSRRSGCINAKARVRVGGKTGRCHLGKNRRIYCCTAPAKKATRKSAKRTAASYGRRSGGRLFFKTPRLNTPASAFSPYAFRSIKRGGKRLAVKRGIGPMTYKK